MVLIFYIRVNLQSMKKAMLMILDGWGLGVKPEADAIAQAKTPVMDNLMKTCPNATLTTFGENVGLPHGQMGNSEVGHMNIGAGRIVYQDLLKINRDIAADRLKDNETFRLCVERAKASGEKVHFIGLLSDGGVHSHIDHLIALVNDAFAAGVRNMYIHAFMDGRDTDPQGGHDYIKKLLEAIEGKATLASVVGRYYAMDRDKRWERTKLAYDLMVHGLGESTSDILETIQERYAAGETDEFLQPIILDQDGLIEANDHVLFFNFRADRPRQITRMLSIDDFDEVETKALPLDFYSMTPYDETFDQVSVLYDKKPLEKTFGELVEQAGGTQIRMAETEKYPHVTYFFSGGREEPFEGERRILMPSPKVATYDLQPEMSATELTDALLADWKENQPDFVCLNFANTDMVGHTGVFSAAMIAAETVDSCVGRIIEAGLALDYQFIIIADHGNSDYMINDDGSPNTAHSTNLVPIIYVANDIEGKQISKGKLADVAPTLAAMMELEPFDEMDGTNLLQV